MKLENQILYWDYAEDQKNWEVMDFYRDNLMEVINDFNNFNDSNNEAEKLKLKDIIYSKLYALSGV